MLEVESLELAAGNKPLVAAVSFALERGERVGLVGPNGSGKTTLLESMLGRREPVSGSARLGYGVEPAYLSQQDAAEGDAGGAGYIPSLREDVTVLQAAQAATGLTRPQAQALLGRFLFSGWEAHEKPVAAISGGERRRLALALVVASGANFLVLDEPTNHLDLESREALEAALEAFPGTVLLVSHDRALLDAVATRILAIEAGSVRSYDGGWADYVRARTEEESRPDPEEDLVAAGSHPARRAGAMSGARSRPARKRKPPSELELVEAEIAEREARIADLERSLAQDWSDVDAIAAHRRARAELQELLARWEALFEQG